MSFRSGMVFALSAGLLLGGCSGAAAGGGGPVTSPTGRVYEPGIEPTRSEFTQAAILANAQGQYQVALDQSRLGIAADSTNPQHYFLAGEAAVGLGDYELADSMWTVAQRIYPAYELDIEPSREAGWADAFNLGIEAYNAGEVDRAIELWSGAHLLYPYHPNAAQNLGVVLTQEERYDEAIEAYREALAALDMTPATRVFEEDEITEREETRAFLQENLAQLLIFTDQYAEAEALLRAQLEADPTNVELRATLANALTRLDRADEASAIYAELLSAPNLAASQLFNIGVSLFNAGEHVRAAEAFGQVTEMQPNSRDAWYNQANALYAAEEWASLVPVAERLVEVDPLNENAALILARSYRELDQNDEALQALERLQALPVFIEELQIRPAGESTTVVGRVTGNAATAGTPVRLNFTFYSDTGQAGTQSVTVNAPAPEQSASFEITLDAPATAYQYQVQ